MKKQILNTSEAAKFLEVSLPTMYNYLRNFEIRQRLGAYKSIGTIGSRHHWKFKLNSLELFLQGNGQHAGAGQSTPESK